MKQTFTWTLALAAGLITSAHAQTSGGTAAGQTGGAGNSATAAQIPPAPGQVVEAVPTLPQGTPVIAVARIRASPKAIVREHKMRVLVGPAEVPYTVHLSHATVYNENGAVIRPNRLADREWVRIEGVVMNDPRRVEAKLVRALGKDPSSVQEAGLNQPGLEHGFIMAVAGSRESSGPAGVVVAPPPVTLIGKVVDDTGPLRDKRKIRVEAAGATWTLEVPKATPVVDVRGGTISVHHVAKGQWIRVHGWQVDSDTVRAARLQEIGPEDAYRASPFFRPGEPLGYIEKTSGSDVRFEPIRMTGVVMAVDLPAGTARLRDDSGQERTVPLASVTVRADGREVDITKLQPGQRVTVEGSAIVFTEAGT